MSPSSPAHVVEIAAAYVYPDLAPTVARVRLRRIGPRARMLAAFQALGLTWLAAVAAVFLPLLHFVLVPSLLLLGPAMFFWKLGEHVTLLGADGPCPACGEPIAHRVKLRAAPRTEIRCDHCGRSVALTIPEAELARDRDA